MAMLLPLESTAHPQALPDGGKGLINIAIDMLTIWEYYTSRADRADLPRVQLNDTHCCYTSSID